jgi:hypothetical protein
VQNLDDETQRQIVDDHITMALKEIRGMQHGLSRNEFVDEVQRRVTRDIGPGFKVRGRVEEILDTFMSSDDSA